MKTTRFVKLEKELRAYNSIMEKALDTILDQDVSEYPIMVVHQHNLEVGIVLVDSDQFTWSIHASSLEEFVTKQLIQPNKIDSFRTIYKDPRKFICLFVLSELGANFIFLPRNKNNKPL